MPGLSPEAMQTRIQFNKCPIVSQKASIENIETGKVNFNRENLCWICEGWLERAFKLNLPNAQEGIQLSDDINAEHYNVFMHFDFDDWEPDIMSDRRKEDINKKGKFINYRMIPQGASLYFYSFNGKAFYNPKQASIEIDPLLKEHISRKYSGLNIITVGDEQKPNNRWNVPIYNFDLDRINVCNTGMSTHSQSTRSL